MGKGLLTAYLAAGVSRGRPLFGCDEAPPPANVILFQGEDTRDDVDDRLRAANADRDRIDVVDRQAGLLVLPGDLPALETAIRQTQARFVVIDPALSIFAENSSNYQAVHRALDSLAAMVERTGTALVFVRHFNKGSGNNPLYRGLGSVALTGIARSVLLLAADPSDPSRRVLAQSKPNLGSISESLSFRIVGRGRSAAIEWSGVSRYTARELLEVMNVSSQCELEDAIYFIYCMLVDGPRTAREICSAAAERIAVKTLKRAKKPLGVNTRRVGYGANGYFLWSLPDDDATYAHLRERMQAELAAGGWQEGDDSPPTDYDVDVDDSGQASEIGGVTPSGGIAPTAVPPPSTAVAPMPEAIPSNPLPSGRRVILRRQPARSNPSPNPANPL